AVAERLPARFRLVSLGEGGFLLTDESGPGDDAPVLAASESFAELMPEAPSYVYCAANALLRLALGKWFNLRASFEPATGPQPFPLLLPNVVGLGEDILAWSDGVEPRTPPRWVAFRAVRGFIRQVASLEGRTLARCAGPPGDVLVAEGYSRLADVLPGMRLFELTEPDLMRPGATLETSHHVGELDGLAVWLTRGHGDGER
ncbi:hypothetical protein, partial [Corallococcus exiguus]|uniref:hypothetical protein n=1 Tax=Corallococcus exiguus TaxID=83462 RepID=UPI0014942C1F